MIFPTSHQVMSVGCVLRHINPSGFYSVYIHIFYMFMLIKMYSYDTRILRTQAVWNKSWKWLHTKQQLYSHLSLIPKITQIRPTNRARHYCRNIFGVFLWSPTHGCAIFGRLARTNISSMQIHDVLLRSYTKRWILERERERERERGRE